jgi:hypothetical protein
MIQCPSHINLESFIMTLSLHTDPGATAFGNSSSSRLCCEMNMRGKAPCCCVCAATPHHLLLFMPIKKYCLEFSHQGATRTSPSQGAVSLFGTML